MQLWVFKCIQQFMFLIPKISRHPFYPTVHAACQGRKDQHILHLVSTAYQLSGYQELLLLVFVLVSVMSTSRQCCTIISLSNAIIQHSTTLPSVGYLRQRPQGQQSVGLLLQDVGACFGQDTRRLMLDGWDQSQLVAIDLTPDYWYAFHEACLIRIVYPIVYQTCILTDNISHMPFPSVTPLCAMHKAVGDMHVHTCLCIQSCWSKRSRIFRRTHAQF